jgi:archaellum component FlaC
MRRLKRLADEIEDSDKTVEEASKVLNRIDEAAEELKDIYYVMFDNLNALYESYPSLYKKIDMTVNLPENEDAMEITSLVSDLQDIMSNFNDKEYLKSYIAPKDPIQDDSDKGDSNNEETVE